MWQMWAGRMCGARLPAAAAQRRRQRRRPPGGGLQGSAHPSGLFVPPRTIMPCAKYCSRAADSSVRGGTCARLPLRTGYPLTDELVERVALQEVGEGGRARRGGGQCQHRQDSRCQWGAANLAARLNWVPVR